MQMMRLLGWVLVLGGIGLQTGYAACNNDTIVVSTNPYNPSALNDSINNCPDANIQVTLRSAGSLAGTIQLSSAININRGAGKTVILRSTQGDAGNTPVTLEQSGPGSPNLISATTQVTIENIGFSRPTNGTTPTIQLNAYGSTVRDCRFFILDNTSDDVSAGIIRVNADSILIERSVFRAPVDNGASTGRSLAIISTVTSGRLEVRSNLFVSTGLYLAKSSLHLFANTFVGSRNFKSPVVFSTAVGDTALMDIRHNLFAFKIDTITPIYFDNTNGILAAAKITRNAYTASVSGLTIAKRVNTPFSPSPATGNAANVVLPRGFSNYAPGVTNRDYPLAQIRVDSTVSPSHADFGRVPDYFSNYPSSLPAISTVPASASFFSNVPFAPLSPAGASWTSGIKFGCFVVLDSRVLPSPVDTTSASLAFQKASDTLQIKLSRLRLDTNYYGKVYPAEKLIFAFANTANALASNDSTQLVASVGTANVIRRDGLATAADSLFAVPNGVRTGGSVFAKLLQYNSYGRAHVLGNAVVATVAGIPKFPVNDISMDLKNTSDLTQGQVTFTLTKGKESIDSVKVVAFTQANARYDSLKVAVSTNPVDVSFDFKNKGLLNLKFASQPLGKVGSATVPGDLAFYPTTLRINANSSTTAYVSVGSSCANNSGTLSTPFCHIDSAMAFLDSTGGQIIILNSSAANTTVTLKGSGTLPIVIAGQETEGATLGPRVVFQGSSTNPAITIQRKNITLQRVVIEMPPSGTQPAVRIEASSNNLLIDGNLFRPIGAATTVSNGPALHFQGYTQGGDIVNNVVWGYQTAVLAVSTPLNSLRFLNNTFLEDKSFTGVSAMTGFKIQGGTAFGAIISSNFFNDVTTPFDASLTGTATKLSNNVYSVSAPNLSGLSETGGLMDNVASMGSIHLAGDKALDTLSGRFTDPNTGQLSCSSFRPCNSLLAGSSGLADSTVSHDFFGLDRKGKNEVGAIEYLPTSSTTPRGYLTIKATDGTSSTSVRVHIASRNQDTTLADSAIFWYMTSFNASAGPTSNGALGVTPLQLSDLEGSGYAKTVDSLEGQKTYHFYAAYFRNTGTSRETGRPLIVSYATGKIKVRPPTVLDIADAPGKVFPDPQGVFTSDNGTFAGWEGTLTFSDEINSGSICAPELSDTAKSAAGFQPFGGAPTIHICIENSDLGKSGSELEWTYVFRIDSAKVSPQINQEQLFAFPEEDGLPVFMPSWSLANDGAGKNVLTVKGYMAGAYDLQFGQFTATANAGTVVASADDILDYHAIPKNEYDTLAVSLQGLGFHTANPLIIATPIPAGGMAKGPFESSYFVKSPVITSGLGDLDGDLGLKVLADYYQRAAAQDAKAGLNDPLIKKPFSLKSSIAASDLKNVLALQGNGISVDAAGGLGEAKVLLPLGESARDNSHGGDKASRSLEVVFTVFDGGLVSHASAFIQTKFTDTELIPGRDKKGAQVNPRNWSLFSFPWDEDLGNDVSRAIEVKDGENLKAGKDYLIYRYKGQGKAAGDYDVYAPGSNFRYDSADALWYVRNESTFLPISQSGKSLDFQPFNYTIPQGKWALFGLPFNFPMRWRDIAGASTDAPSQVWRYRPSPVKRWEAATLDSVLNPWEGLALNGDIKAIHLVFPVRDSARSNSVAAKQTAAAPLWSASLMAANSTAAMELRIGKAEKEYRFSEAPGVPGQDFRLDLASQQGPASSLIQDLSGGAEGVWPLRIQSAPSGEAQISLTLRRETGEMPLYLVETLSQTVTPLVQDQPITLALRGTEAKDYQIVAGDGMLQNVLNGGVSPYMLRLGNFPNPFRHATRIRYDLPAQHRDVTYDLSIRDIAGRSVLQKRIQAGPKFDYTWNGLDDKQAQVPAGSYHISLTAKTSAGTSFRARRVLLKWSGN